MKIIQKNSGLTLIEMLVATTVFVIAITLASSLLVYVIRAQYKSNTMRLVQQEGRYAMESISREAKLAFGSNIVPAIKVDNSSNTLILTSIDPDSGSSLIKTFRYDGTKITEETQIGASTKSGDLTSDKVTIKPDVKPDGTNYLIFDCPITYTAGNIPAFQQFVTIRFKIEASRGSGPWQSASMILKTTVSSRDYDYKN